ncbi:unnamed protein product [Knipowitschia caucasica]|uniref:Carboxylic ester hydrolase n=1 Tax=Knipowitschia caucasica TaxID=637954 RepID=A0AAV2IYU9_KNICA
MNLLRTGLALLLALASTSAASLGVVQTEGGLVQGQNIPVGLMRSVEVFKGVPFAAKPGLFQKPRPHPGWSGILKATKFAPRCLQVNIVQTQTFGSEDCLHLNIWVPHGKKVSSNLPVMIWFYGGGFMVGGSMGPNFLNNYLYSGQELSKRGDVIVVSAGYRVGVLGFLSTGDPSLPGNYGLWDQQAAIAWVHRNIRSFGGDPSNITIFGESAGGASVSFQILSPHTKGLVRRAISQSGVALCPWAFRSNPRDVAEQVAEKVGCPTDHTMADCLRSMDTGNLTMAAPKILQGNPDKPGVMNLQLTPVVDGDFLPDHPSKLFHNAAEVDFLLGVNNMDGHLFTSQDIPSLRSKTQDTPIEDLRRLLGAYTRGKGPAALDLAFSEYTSDWGSSPSQDTIKKTAVNIGTDFIFLVPIQTAVYLHAATATSGRTFSYLLSEPSLMAGPGKPYHDWVGSDHADDLQFVFGKPFTTPKAYADKHRALSAHMMAYWTNFARTGDPNVGPSAVPVTWPQMDHFSQQYLNISSNMNEPSTSQKMRLRFVKLWTRDIPSLP